jgi:glucose-6-phosphate isomerase
MSISIELKYLRNFVPDNAIEQWTARVNEAHLTVMNRTGRGSEFLGWMDLPEKSLSIVNKLSQIAGEFAAGLDSVVVIGIGGSYLGTRAVTEALTNPFGENRPGPEILFAGHQLVDTYYHQLTAYLKNRNWGIIVVSKSGTTTEPAIAFRILKQALEHQVGPAKAASRVIAITDQSRGALRKLADQLGYATFVIPDDVGGRFSVLSPVGLVPLVAAGFSADQLLEGALHMKQNSGLEIGIQDNPVTLYAALRNILLSQGKTTEVFCSFQPQLHYVAEWWKQLYGESEGKDGKGIFPAAVEYTTDLHSMGQYMQDGPRNLFETMLEPENPHDSFPIPSDPQDLDGLNFLAGSDMSVANKAALTGTAEAHVSGGVPVIGIKTGPINEFMLGELFFFFEKACAISGYLLGVNPFDQPGVELYKKNMFRLLGKPGY